MPNLDDEKIGPWEQARIFFDFESDILIGHFLIDEHCVGWYVSFPHQFTLTTQCFMKSFGSPISYIEQSQCFSSSEFEPER